MPRKAVLHEENYKIADEVIRLSVVVGERQYGTSIVFLDDEAISNGDVDELPLGEGAALEGKTVEVYTMVTDVRDNTDEMSVSWILTGGKKKLIATESSLASKKFGSQMFKGVFQFTKGKKKDPT
jgi:hypothetical protein